MKLQQIVFPVYKLGKIKPLQEDGVTFYIHRVEKNEKVINTLYIVDDTNIKKETLASRRLFLENNKQKLFKIKTAIFFLGDLIKLAKPDTWFIDSAGKIFKYTKQTFVDLIFKPIEQIIPIVSGGAIIVVRGIVQRFKVLHSVKGKPKYAALLKVGPLSYILYGLYDECHKNTRRKI